MPAVTRDRGCYRMPGPETQTGELFAHATNRGTVNGRQRFLSTPTTE
jgi:hypothetical protein